MPMYVRILIALVAVTAMAAPILAGGSAGDLLDDPERERICLQFVLNQMSTPDGAVLTSTEVERSFFSHKLNREKLTESGVLSESAGLMMIYAVKSNRQPLFDRQFDLLQARMLSSFGLTYWKLTADLEMTANASASVDDLRIAHALILAYENWGEERYLHQALSLGRNIRRWNASDGRMRDFLNWRGLGEPIVSEQVTLCYLDLRAMTKLAAYDPIWDMVRGKAADLLHGGRMPNGLFMDLYRYDEKKYVGQKGNMINVSLAAESLSFIEPGNRTFLEFIKKQLGEYGVVYAHYDVVTGEPLEFFESTSVYAICSMIARRQGEQELADRLLSLMNNIQVTESGSSVFGAYCDDEVFSFDNLLALLALQQANEQPVNSNNGKLGTGP